MAIRITEDGTVIYENEPDIDRELFPNIPEGGGSPEQIAQAVDEWLENHPEATTTVTDGSITREKLDSELNSYIEDITNLSESLKSAITTLEDTVYETQPSITSVTNVTTPAMQNTTPIMLCDIPSGTEFGLVITADEGVFPGEKTTLYYISNGSPTRLDGDFPLASGRLYVAPADITGFSIYQTGLTNGSFTLTLSFPDVNTDSLEYKAKNAMLTDVYIDDSLVNRLNPAICLLDKRNNANGEILDNTSYFLTDFIPIAKNETLYFYRINEVEARTSRMFAAYDKNKIVIPSLGSNNNVYSITQSGEMAFVRCTIQYDAGDTSAPHTTPYNTGIISTNSPEYIPTYGNTAVFVSDYLRKNIRIKATDTESTIISKLVSAYKIGNCDVSFDRADYMFGDALATVAADYNLPINEIPVGHGCRYYFNGATLTATLDLSNLTPAEGDAEYYCNFFGCQRRPTSFEMYDGVLIATDTRYIVHDESTHLTGTFKHLYENMEMDYRTNARQEEIRKCIGGGTGADGVVEIVGCKFTTDATDVCVSYHGNSEDVLGAKFDINVRNSWFSNCMRAGSLSANQTARLLYSGNSSAEAPRTAVGWAVTSFCNEIRS